LGSGGGLANIPLTLSRWTEESRVLDGDAAHDYITGVSFIINYSHSACSSWSLSYKHKPLQVRCIKASDFIALSPHIEAEVCIHYVISNNCLC